MRYLTIFAALLVAFSAYGGITLTSQNDSLQRAFDSATAGDTVAVDSATSWTVVSDTTPATVEVLVVDHSMSIIGGAGGAETALSAWRVGDDDSLVISGGNSRRVIRITSGTLTLQDVAISNGIYADGTGGNHAWEGAGIYVGSGDTLVMNRCTVQNNNNYQGNGGGIFVGAGAVALLDSVTFKGNTAFKGACLYLNKPDSVSVTNCTFQDIESGSQYAVYANGGASTEIFFSTTVFSNVDGQAIEVENNGASARSIVFLNTSFAGGTSPTIANAHQTLKTWVDSLYVKND